jgi:hypothetical protein
MGIDGQNSSIFLSLLLESLQTLSVPKDTKFPLNGDISLVFERERSKDTLSDSIKNKCNLEYIKNIYITNKLLTVITELIGKGGQLNQEKAIIEESQLLSPLDLVKGKFDKSNIQNLYNRIKYFTDKAILAKQGINRSDSSYGEIADLHAISSNNFEVIDDTTNFFTKYNRLVLSSKQNGIGESEILPFSGNQTVRIVNNGLSPEQSFKHFESVSFSNKVESESQSSNKEGINALVFHQLVDSKPVSVYKDKHEAFPLTESHSLNTLDNFSKVASIAKDGKSFIVALEPEGLGKLNIQLSLDQGFINVKINVSSNATKTLIENNIHYIVDLLLKDGLNIGGLSVNLENNNRWNWDDESQRSTNSSKTGLNVNTLEKLYLAKALDPYRHITEGVISIFA